ncbi:UDP-glucose 4-epimerase [Massilia sp. Root351]|jgi:UDP-glucose 4-epimerase|uniref:UDP-glucose 4-epimerase GalE n=1 Tax=Massilia sp. Root351 TaxID=1736522 RepID=UPI00070C533E|nr:UDP-glucose 4-epimerase GalE [Massilia sp. Root351]KQV79081.1 UDP-glucose 4-epimerase [Massilia sp. Root351]
MKILVTGGLGYIGSHTCVELLAEGHDVVVLDNLSNAQPAVQQRVERIAGRSFPLVRADVRERAALRAVFREHAIGAVIHFAGLKAVGESVSKPLEYYDNNVAGSLVLFETMAEFDVRTLVFSSSATVYGDPASVPITEDFPLSATNPYGRSKLMVEEMLRDLCRSDPRWRVALLRYFNPVGAHESGLIGETPNGIPNNLLPYVAQVAAGERPLLSVHGNDYPTPDGTGVRDYIHVTDLALGHVRTLARLAQAPGLLTYNLGTGRGYSVLEMVQAFAAASGRPVPYQIGPRRPGDVAQCYADPTRAERELGWKAERAIDQMCVDAWRYQSAGLA